MSTKHSTIPWRAAAAGLCVSLGAYSGVVGQESLAEAVITKEGIGPVKLWMSEGELRDSLGTDVLRPFDVYEDGMCSPGTIVFSGSDMEIVVAWEDSARTTVAQLRVRRSVRWHTRAGVRIGSTLEDLEGVAGRPIEFNGFKWGYGGRARWQEDDLEILVDLAPSDESLQAAVGDPLYREIIGDRTVRSDHPLVRRMRVTVQAITLTGSGRVEYEYECGQPDGDDHRWRSMAG